MTDLRSDNWNALRPEVGDRIRPFMESVAASLGSHLQCAAVTGSAVVQGPDFDSTTIHSVLVFDELALRYVEEIAPLGKKYGRKGVAAPLVMSSEYIRESLDVFPLEFLSIKLAHVTVHGKDVFEKLEIPPADLRRQCERELKSFLIRLRQGYLSSAGNVRVLEKVLRDAASSFFSIVRGVLHLLHAEILHDERKDVETLKEKVELSATPIHTQMLLEEVRAHPKEDFEKFYAFAEEFSAKVNNLEIE